MSPVLFRLKHIDWMTFVVVIMLTILGISAIFSLDRGQSLTPYPYLMKQIIAFGIGIAIILFIQQFQYIFFASVSTYVYLVSIALLVAVLFFGETVRGTRGWFMIFGFSLQPVEFAKSALVIHLAHFLSTHRDYARTWWLLFGSFVITSVPVALTLTQPDVGSALMMVATWLVMVLVSGIHRFQFIIGVVMTIIILAVSWLFLLEPYQKDRIHTFFDPTEDRLGRGYNVAQSMIAVGSGQIMGRGLGFGSQSQLRFLPESRNDFIFAALSEELGLVGTTLIILLFFILWMRVLYGTYRVSDDFGMFVLVGFFALTLIQTCVNIGMNIGLMPVTGVGLPFVSYGGSALIAYYVLLGVVLTVLRDSKGVRAMSFF